MPMPEFHLPDAWRVTASPIPWSLLGLPRLFSRRPLHTASA
jgi:hypothetical protein